MGSRHHAVLALVSQGYPPPQDTFLRATHPSAAPPSLRALDLHVLGMPPAFALSQDQTLRFIQQPSRPPNELTQRSLYRTLYLAYPEIRKTTPGIRPCTKSTPPHAKRRQPIPSIPLSHPDEIFKEQPAGRREASPSGEARLIRSTSDPVKPVQRCLRDAETLAERPLYGRRTCPAGCLASIARHA